MLHQATIVTPLGNMIALTDNTYLYLLQFKDNPKLKTMMNKIAKHHEIDTSPTKNSLIERLQHEISNYFKGKITQFSIPIRPYGTIFQQKSWHTIQHVPYGSTISYQQQSANMNQHKAHRAVANANSTNPICILIPCHRIIRSNGKISGYSGSVNRKQWLLKHERALI